MIQLVGNVLFTIAATMLWHRTRRNCRKLGIQTPFPKTDKFKIFVAAIIISDAMIVIRGVYRVCELAQGWRGYLITHEPWFYGFDTAPMIICMAVWVIGQPGFTLGRELANPHFTGKKEKGQAGEEVCMVTNGVPNLVE